MAEVAFEAVTKRYPDGSVALHALDLTVADGELVTLVGPSGAGKSTVLALVAGAEEPTEGQVRIGSESVADLPPAQRDVAWVRQQDALYPSRTVEDCMGFALRMRGRPPQEVTERVRTEARVLGIQHLLRRRPAALSAGERRAAQTAKAMVRPPQAFLLDEPLVGLDTHQRVRFRREIALLQEGYGATMLYATNEVRDALALGGRLAVLHEGRLQQLGPPREVWAHPANRVVASLLCDPPMNILDALVEPDPPGWWLTVCGRRFRCWAPSLAEHAGGVVPIGLRADDLAPAPPDDPAALPARLVAVQGYGPAALVEVELADGQRLVMPVRRLTARPGDPLPLGIDDRRIHVFHPATGVTLVSPAS